MPPPLRRFCHFFPACVFDAAFSISMPFFRPPVSSAAPRCAAAMQRRHSAIFRHAFASFRRHTFSLSDYAFDERRFLTPPQIRYFRLSAIISHLAFIIFSLRARFAADASDACRRLMIPLTPLSPLSSSYFTPLRRYAAISMPLLAAFMPRHDFRRFRHATLIPLFDYWLSLAIEMPLLFRYFLYAAPNMPLIR